MKIWKEFITIAIIALCVLTYVILLLPDPEVELWLKIVTGVPVIGGLLAYVLWLVQKINAED